jgi:hypothetical protein
VTFVVTGGCGISGEGFVWLELDVKALEAVKKPGSADDGYAGWSVG